MTAAHCRISDTACADRLQDLNPAGDLINCAQSNYRDLASQPFSEAIASATLLASLVPGSHGYVFLKSGFSDTRLKNADRTLDGKRFRFFPPDERLPTPTTGLWVDESRRLAILTGRAHNRPQAPSASQSVYRHGGFSLMEMLTPWLVLGPVGSA